MLRDGGPRLPLPFSLYEERATGARWLCAFLKHQLPERSCRQAMHCGTGAGDFFLVNIFRLSPVSGSSSLSMVRWCVSHRYGVCGVMFEL